MNYCFLPSWEHRTKAVAERPCRSASEVAAFAAFVASAVAWPARVALDPFVHCLLSYNEKKIRVNARSHKIFNEANEMRNRKRSEK